MIILACYIYLILNGLERRQKMVNRKIKYQPYYFLGKFPPFKTKRSVKVQTILLDHMKSAVLNYIHFVCKNRNLINPANVIVAHLPDF